MFDWKNQQDKFLHCRNLNTHSCIFDLWKIPLGTKNLILSQVYFFIQIKLFLIYSYSQILLLLMIKKQQFMTTAHQKNICFPTLTESNSWKLFFLCLWPDHRQKDDVTIELLLIPFRDDRNSELRCLDPAATPWGKESSSHCKIGFELLRFGFCFFLILSFQDVVLFVWQFFWWLEYV